MLCEPGGSQRSDPCGFDHLMSPLVDMEPQLACETEPYELERTGLTSTQFVLWNSERVGCGGLVGCVGNTQKDTELLSVGVLSSE